MKWRLAWPGLPLLARELTEQSARRRTYIIRVVYAVILYGIASFALYEHLASRGFDIDSLSGSGRQLLLMLTGFQLAGVYLILPAITCGVVTAEKESDTLGLLLLTKLGPWTILWEKLLSRLFPMVMFLLLLLPLYAIAYGLGGFTPSEMAYYAWIPLATAFQVACFSLLCSVLFRTTAGAFIASYIGGVLAIWLGSIVVFVVARFAAEIHLFELYFGTWGTSLETMVLGSDRGYPMSFAYPLAGWWYLILPEQTTMYQGGGGFAFGTAFTPPTATSQLSPLFCSFLASFLVPLSGLFCLAIARFFLWRRAFIPAGNPLMAFFRGLDRFFHGINQNRVTRGVQLVSDRNPLPDNLPVAWMETTKRSLATLRYRVRILLVMMLPLLPFIALIAFDDGLGTYSKSPYGMCYPIWCVIALLLGVQASGLIAGERSRQTLDVLVSTPLTAGEILEQKLAGVWRLSWTLAIPYATAVLYEIWHCAFRSGGVGSNTTHWSPYDNSVVEVPTFNLPTYLVGSVVLFLVYTRLLGWLGMYYSLRSSSRIKAILWTLSTVLAACIIGPTAAVLLDLSVGWTAMLQQFEPMLFSEALRWTSPVVALSVHECQSYVYRSLPAIAPILAHAAVAAGITFWLRQQCYQQFGKAVHRIEPGLRRRRRKIAVPPVSSVGAAP